MIFRVSELEAFRQWRDDEEASVEDLLARLRGQVPPSDLMEAGTAFHSALETAADGAFETLEAQGYTFDIACEIALPLARTREVRLYKTYGPITVTGKCDVLDALVVEDHKTTGRFNPDRFLDGMQWRYYLDIFGARVFRWNVFEIDQTGDKRFKVFGFHRLEQYAYPRMHDDCLLLACDLGQFAAEHMPERREAA